VVNNIFTGTICRNRDSSGYSRLMGTGTLLRGKFNTDIGYIGDEVNWTHLLIFAIDFYMGMIIAAKDRRG
jgi:hypothetical protein